MKAMKTILVVCTVGMIIVGIIWTFNKPKFVTQEVKELESITVIFNINRADEKTVSITELSEFQYIYELLATTPTHVERYPRQSISTMVDPRFVLRLLYSNGEVDEFRTAERAECVYRLLDNKVVSDHSGYIMGENPMLLEYILTLEEES